MMINKLWGIKAIALLIFCLCRYSGASAQPQIGIYGIGAFPLNTFHERGYRNGYGMGFSLISESFMEGKKGFPKLQLGLNMDFEGFGSRKYKGMPLDTPQKGTATVFFSDNSLGISGLLRASFPEKRHITTYADFLIGPRFFFTGQTIQQDNPKLNPDYEESTSNNVAHSMVLDLGIGLGMQYRLSDAVSLDLGLSYLHGSAGSYVLLKDIHHMDTNQFNYTPQHSETDLLLLRIGLLIRVDGSCGNDSGTGSTSSPHSTIHIGGGGGRPNHIGAGRPGL